MATWTGGSTFLLSTTKGGTDYTLPRHKFPSANTPHSLLHAVRVFNFSEFLICSSSLFFQQKFSKILLPFFKRHLRTGLLVSLTKIPRLTFLLNICFNSILNWLLSRNCHLFTFLTLKILQNILRNTLKKSLNLELTPVEWYRKLNWIQTTEEKTHQCFQVERFWLNHIRMWKDSGFYMSFVHFIVHLILSVIGWASDLLTQG